MPNESATEQAAPEDLWRLRRSLDNIDTALVAMLAERFRVTRAVGQLKARHRLDAVDVAREEAKVARLREAATRAGLDEDFAEEFIRRVMAEVVRQHREIAQKG
ncbi:chorismate mutase [Falsiroseomonas selenitidurans]|uniref:chorismate mutase n=1 Tax=Falsiroseomonas selenitidurans TaxID=2716335 RepID=A0ABX1E5W1_9PROT|nr:chorismate mutase [Falsiroseomonas selenitidurans]NKC32567.1 chorismate mutase [Falsiroseomonas selenitidurans]